MDEEELEETEDEGWSEDPCSSCGTTFEVSTDMYGDPMCHDCFDEAWL